MFYYSLLPLVNVALVAKPALTFALMPAALSSASILETAVPSASSRSMVVVKRSMLLSLLSSF
jgi:hypothetical protein